ncbi:unnamed protein product [Bursaphelenchus xylophilus]|uniref:(pine wood nematode) hypothetical protein n=1 Tax=Bursaphelenchus xylophilus TaxID=6326 RepID=A0A1I7S5V6_BURXY|nr:unnamed protein product [Bursaphelenchus xylophilus]CAG9125097.1 unnamed protein product [Bursaphelenchus xylophilus]
MFMVSAPSSIQHAFCGQQATTSRQQFANECDELAAHVQPKISAVGQFAASGLGGLRRTVSSLQSAKPCLLSDMDNDCVVEAKQVEMDFATLTNQAFFLRVRAPNGEVSDRLSFPGYGETHHFSPVQNGCGHGDWEFIVEKKVEKKVVVVNREKIYLDGVGTLFFTINDNLKVKLASQEFLRLPSASQCCSKVGRKSN